MKSNKGAFYANVRTIEAGLEIGYFRDGVNTFDNGAKVVNSTTNLGIKQNHADQLFRNELDVRHEIATFDGNSRLDGTAYLLSDDSNIGWIGNQQSGSDGNFKPAQVVNIEFFISRRFPRFNLCGNQTRKRDSRGNLLTANDLDYHYPQVFTIKILDVNDRCLWREDIDVSDGFAIDLTDTNHEYKFSPNEGFAFMPRISRWAKRIELEIKTWSVPRVLPRLTYLSGQMHERFDGDTLQSIEILEEKTADVSELSYGISANYCKASFLHRDRMFFRDAHFQMLTRNRSVLPYIRCTSDDAEPISLGKFFSESWQLDDSSPFMSVKAYDVLYGLQELEINYGMEICKDGSANGGEILIKPYTNQTLAQIISRVFELIDEARAELDMFDELLDDKMRADLDKLKLLDDEKIPYVLIEKKSAWDVLADIANLACAYIYANRKGHVVIKQDEFDTKQNSKEPLFTVDYEEEDEDEPKMRGQSYHKVQVRNNHQTDDTRSIRENGLREYHYNATMFITDNEKSGQKFLGQMANKILCKYANGRSFVETEWNGDANLQLSDKFLARSQFEDKVRTFEVISNEIMIDGRFSQTTKGRELATTVTDDSKNLADSLLKIDEDNAFGFNIPVKSRTVVNQVNVSYQVLEAAEEDGEVVTINRRDCKFGDDDDRFIAVVNLSKVYEKIEEITVAGLGIKEPLPVEKEEDEEEEAPIKVVKVLEATASSLKIEFTTETSDFSKIEVKINGG